MARTPACLRTGPRPVCVHLGARACPPHALSPPLGVVALAARRIAEGLVSLCEQDKFPLERLLFGRREVGVGVRVGALGPVAKRLLDPRRGGVRAHAEQVVIIDHVR